MRACDKFREPFGETGRHFLVDTPLDEDSAAGRAGLAAVLDDGIDENRHRRFQVGVGEDDLRRLAAEFHSDAAVVDCSRLLDGRAGQRRPRECHVVDQRM